WHHDLTGEEIFGPEECTGERSERSSFESEDITISPNPANEVIEIRKQSSVFSSSTSIMLYNHLDQSMTTYLTSAGESNVITLPLNNLSSGLYFLVLNESGHHPFISKVAVAKY
ncbi:MAG: T9SS type A sorting domain-containing protein, partial [Leadbetterella sp.]|nr:T9SS type A sorting domain-containing protein [Leadbetterella sp.]